MNCEHSIPINAKCGRPDTPNMQRKVKIDMVKAKLPKL
jgi:hypothetical protein